MDRDDIICPCVDVTVGEIMDAYEDGATTVDAVKDATGAGSICGACLDNIEELLTELKSKSTPQVPQFLRDLTFSV